MTLKSSENCNIVCDDDEVPNTRVYYVSQEELRWIQNQTLLESDWFFLENASIRDWSNGLVSQREFECYAQGFCGKGDDWSIEDDYEHTLYFCMGEAEKVGKPLVWFKDEDELAP